VAVRTQEAKVLGTAVVAVAVDVIDVEYQGPTIPDVAQSTCGAAIRYAVLDERPTQLMGLDACRGRPTDENL
jgi:hypothetical protein